MILENLLTFDFTHNETHFGDLSRRENRSPYYSSCELVHMQVLVKLKNSFSCAHLHCNALPRLQIRDWYTVVISFVFIFILKLPSFG